MGVGWGVKKRIAIERSYGSRSLALRASPSITTMSYCLSVTILDFLEFCLSCSTSASFNRINKELQPNSMP